MSTQPAVIVNKRGGFLTALVQGVFGFLIVTVLCAAILGLYGVWVLDKKTDLLLDVGKLAAGDIDNWQRLLPAPVADALTMQYDPSYAEHVTLDVQLVPVAGGSRVRVVAENTGDSVVSHLVARVVIEDADGVPVDEAVTIVATPLTFDFGPLDEHAHRGGQRALGRGPLNPGSTRRYTFEVPDLPTGALVSFEVTELRTWVRPEHRPPTVSVPAAPAVPAPVPAGPIVPTASLTPAAPVTPPAPAEPEVVEDEPAEPIPAPARRTAPTGRGG